MDEQLEREELVQNEENTDFAYMRKKDNANYREFCKNYVKMIDPPDLDKLAFFIINKSGERYEEEINILHKFTEKFKFFQELNAKQSNVSMRIHQKCCAKMKYESIQKGQQVFMAGEIPEKFYIILSGSVNVLLLKSQDVIQKEIAKFNESLKNNNSKDSPNILARVSNLMKKRDIIKRIQEQEILSQKMLQFEFQKQNTQMTNLFDENNSDEGEEDQSNPQIENTNQKITSQNDVKFLQIQKQENGQKTIKKSRQELPNPNSLQMNDSNPENQLKKSQDLSQNLNKRGVSLEVKTNESQYLRNSRSLFPQIIFQNNEIDPQINNSQEESYLSQNQESSFSKLKRNTSRSEVKAQVQYRNSIFLNFQMNQQLSSSLPENQNQEMLQRQSPNMKLNPSQLQNDNVINIALRKSNQFNRISIKPEQFEQIRQSLEYTPRKSQQIFFSQPPIQELKDLEPDEKDIQNDPVYLGLGKIRLQDIAEPDKFIQDGVLKHTYLINLGKGQMFGELGLLMKKPRAATIIAKEDTEFAVLDAEDYISILQAGEMKKFNRRINFFSSSLLKNCGREVVVKFSYNFQKYKFEKGQYIFMQDESPKFVYLIKKGTIQMQKKLQINEEIEDVLDYGYVNQSKEERKEIKLMKKQKEFIDIIISEYTIGQSFGEIEVMQGCPRTTSALCISLTATVYALSIKSFLILLQENKFLVKDFQNQISLKEDFQKKKINLYLDSIKKQNQINRNHIQERDKIIIKSNKFNKQKINPSSVDTIFKPTISEFNQMDNQSKGINQDKCNEDLSKNQKNSAKIILQFSPKNKLQNSPRNEFFQLPKSQRQTIPQSYQPSSPQNVLQSVQTCNQQSMLDKYQLVNTPRNQSQRSEKQSFTSPLNKSNLKYSPSQINQQCYLNEKGEKQLNVSDKLFQNQAFYQLITELVKSKQQKLKSYQKKNSESNDSQIFTTMLYVEHLKKQSQNTPLSSNKMKYGQAKLNKILLDNSIDQNSVNLDISQMDENQKRFQKKQNAEKENKTSINNSINKSTKNDKTIIQGQDEIFESPREASSNNNYQFNSPTSDKQNYTEGERSFSQSPTSSYLNQDWTQFQQRYKDKLYSMRQIDKKQCYLQSTYTNKINDRFFQGTLKDKIQQQSERSSLIQDMHNSFGSTACLSERETHFYQESQRKRYNSRESHFYLSTQNKHNQTLPIDYQESYPINFEQSYNSFQQDSQQIQQIEQIEEKKQFKVQKNDSAVYSNTPFREGLEDEVDKTNDKHSKKQTKSELPHIEQQRNAQENKQFQHYLMNLDVRNIQQYGNNYNKKQYTSPTQRLQKRYNSNELSTLKRAQLRLETLHKDNRQNALLSNHPVRQDSFFNPSPSKNKQVQEYYVSAVNQKQNSTLSDSKRQIHHHHNTNAYNFNSFQERKLAGNSFISQIDLSYKVSNSVQQAQLNCSTNEDESQSGHTQNTTQVLKQLTRSYYPSSLSPLKNTSKDQSMLEQNSQLLGERNKIKIRAQQRGMKTSISQDINYKIKSQRIQIEKNKTTLKLWDGILASSKTSNRENLMDDTFSVIEMADIQNDRSNKVKNLNGINKYLSVTSKHNMFRNKPTKMFLIDRYNQENNSQIKDLKKYQNEIVEMQVSKLKLQQAQIICNS